MGGQEVAPGVAGGIEAGFEPGREGGVRGEWVGPGQTRVDLAGVRGSPGHLCSGCIRRHRGGQNHKLAPHAWASEPE